MKSIITLTILFVLISCGGGNDVNVVPLNCEKNSSAIDTVRFNSIDITVESSQGLIAGIPVQIDHDGQCLLSDINGVVTFNNLSPGKHDIHVLGMADYDWKSIYNLLVLNDSLYSKTIFLHKKSGSSTGNTTPIPRKPVNSYTLVKGTIQNKSPTSYVDIYNFTNPITYFITSTGLPYTTNYMINNGLNVPPGTQVRNDLWAIETEYRSTNKEKFIIDAIQKPEFTVNSVASSNTENGVKSTQNLSFQPVDIKPTKSELMQFSSITYPTGLSFSSINIDTRIDFKFFNFFNLNLYSMRGNNLASNASLSAYIAPFNVFDISYRLTANTGGPQGTEWTYDATIPIGSINVIVNPKIATVPTILPNQQGATISWNLENIPVDSQSIFISGVDTLEYWNITIIGNTNNITLPKLPDGLTSLLKNRSKYNIELRGNLLYSNKPIAEFYSSTGQWTR